MARALEYPTSLVRKMTWAMLASVRTVAHLAMLSYRSEALSALCKKLSITTTGRC